MCAALVGCGAQRSPTPAATARREVDRNVYRLDFVLDTADGAGTTSTTAFTLNLPESSNGEMMVGKNVALVVATPGSLASPRQDVGLKVKANVRPLGDNLLVEVSTEMSGFEPPSTVRKMVSKGSALAAAGKPALVSTLADDQHRYKLSVTATRL